MPAITAAVEKIDRLLREKCPGSRARFQEARKSIAGGVTHDGRYNAPWPMYVARADQGRKWDVDGNEYVDYWVGHGSLILGHGDPEIVEAIRETAPHWTHAGGCHDLEIEWAELALSMFPAADKLRFTMSGTEAVMLALRLARRFTGKDKVVKFQGHFHGWSDFVVPAVDPPFEIPMSRGVAKAVLDLTVAIEPGDLKRLDATLAADDNVAAVILEPSGGSGGTVPASLEFLRGVREVTEKRGVLLICDEVITGFRAEAGGVQTVAGIEPDLTTLAKILAGGTPSGAVCGRAEVMDAMDFSDDPKANRAMRVAQNGTYNANPICAAAGIACLKRCRTGEPQKAVAAYNEKLKAAVRDVLRGHGLHWTPYGIYGIFHTFMTDEAELAAKLDDDPYSLPPTIFKTHKHPAAGPLRRALMLYGVDIPGGTQFWTCSAHTDKDLEDTAAGWDKAVGLLKECGIL